MRTARTGSLSSGATARTIAADRSAGRARGTAIRTNGIRIGDRRPDRRLGCRRGERASKGSALARAIAGAPDPESTHPTALRIDRARAPACSATP